MKRLLFETLVVTILFASATVSAKTINLYSEPKIDSKVISTVNTEAGVTIVYTPKNGDWTKVADPSNGEVGWVKSSELGGSGYNMRVFTSGNGTHSYSVFQFGNSNSHFNQKQLENEMRHFEQQQRTMRIHMAQMFNDMFYFPQPVFVPVVMIPKEANVRKTDSAKSPHITQAVQTAQKNKS